GELTEFYAIIASVVGGVLLTGGYGSVIGAAVGALTFAMVQQGVIVTGVDGDWFKVFVGVILVLAVIFNNYVRQRAQRRWSDQRVHRLGRRQAARGPERLQVLRQRRRLVRRVDVRPRRRGHLPPGRQRRREVHADQDPVGSAQAVVGDLPVRRQG